MNKIKFDADRWWLGAHSPLNFDALKDADRVAVINTGWARHPRDYGSLMVTLANKGVFPLSVDVRYGYANQDKLSSKGSVSLLKKLATQPYNAGSSNTYFPNATERDNRGRLRKATATLAICDSLGIDRFHVLGHSDGGRTASLVATAVPDRIDSLTVINGVGTGRITDAQTKAKHTFAKAVSERRELVRQSEVEFRDLTLGGLRSTVYTLSHLRRFRNEYRTIAADDGWPILAEVSQFAPVNVINGVDDPLISHDDAARNAGLYPNINFISASGGHNNLWTPAVQKTIAVLIAA